MKFGFDAIYASRSFRSQPFFKLLTTTSYMFSSHLISMMQAGKGRTGLMVSSYLTYCGMSADEALQLYADRRTTNNEGVS